MTKSDYIKYRHFIRDNGLRYTAYYAASINNFSLLALCDNIANIIKQTDWLKMRQDFAHNEKPNIAFRLTTK